MSMLASWWRVTPHCAMPALQFLHQGGRVREVAAQPAFDGLIGPEVSPGAKAESDSELDEYLVEHLESAYHPCGTCKMGGKEDQGAVVDSEGRVYGVEGLRVVDASIMPLQIGGNTNAPTIMIAEKASDMILGKAPLPPQVLPGDK